jgi:hypothetical protein
VSSPDPPLSPDVPDWEALGCDVLGGVAEGSDPLTGAVEAPVPDVLAWATTTWSAARGIAAKPARPDASTCRA